MLDGDPGYKPGGWQNGQWYGVRGLLRYLESKKYKMHVRVLLARYRGYDQCPDCGGTRLRTEALAVRVGGTTSPSSRPLPVGELPRVSRRADARQAGARDGGADLARAVVAARATSTRSGSAISR